MLKVEDIFSGGSGHGHSYWKRWHGCQRAARLSEELGDTSVPDDNMQTGSVFHVLAEVQERTGQHVDTQKVLPYSQAPSNPLAEGARIFRQYRTICPPGFWGKALLVEAVLGKTEEDRAIISNMFDNFPEEVTIKPDLITEVDSYAAKRIKDKFKLTVRPGNYIIDYKTVAGIPTNQDSYFHSLQFKLYQLVWNACRPNDSVSGTLCLLISRAASVRVVPLVVPAATELDRRIVSAFLHEALRRRTEAMSLDKAPVNNTYCHTCPHFTSGLCERY